MSLFRLGAAFGISLGASLVFAGCLAWVTGIGAQTVNTISSLLRGYGAGPLASIVGGVWGAAGGFTFGVAVAWLYNRLPE
ncbi:MAG: hypothetical protein ACE5HD_11115 [Acidobacteriota bacterium]